VVATLFDFNGVLVDDEDVHLACFREVLLPLGIGIPDDVYKDRYLGFDDAGAFAALLADAGRACDAETVRRLIEAKKPLYMEHARRGLRVFPGAAGLVRRRAARGVVGVVSGALAAEIDFALGVMGVRDAVAFVVAAEHVRACKPDPEGYLVALARLGADQAAVVVEDSLAGVEAAKRAGLRCVAVAHSYDEAALRAAGADAVARTVADLDDALLEGP